MSFRQLTVPRRACVRPQNYTQFTVYNFVLRLSNFGTLLLFHVFSSRLCTLTVVFKCLVKFKKFFSCYCDSVLLLHMLAKALPSYTGCMYSFMIAGDKEFVVGRWRLFVLTTLDIGLFIQYMFYKVPDQHDSLTFLSF